MNYTEAVLAPLSPRQVAILLVLMTAALMFALLRPYADLPSKSIQSLSVSSNDQPVATRPAVVPMDGLSPIFTPEVQVWKDSIQRWSNQYRLNPNLTATVMQIESCGNPKAVSIAGARGLFQVMPANFQPGDNMLDPEVNARRGLDYLRKGLDLANGDIGLALAGYNGGHGLIGRSQSSWPYETQRYYRWGTGLYQDSSSGTGFSQTLLDWLSAGGRSLCQQADVQLGLH